MSLRTLKSSFPFATMVLALASTPALALEFNGYLRAGTGSDLDGGNQACFKLPGSEAKYRLGNECEVYGEALLGQTLYSAGEAGPTLSAHVMASLFTPDGLENLFAGDNNYGLAQAYLQASRLDVLNGGSFWLGNRYYKREDVHINDFFYWNPSGIGLGIEDYRIGAQTLSYAVFRKDNIDQKDAIPRHDLQLRGIPANAGGELQLGLSHVHGGDNGHSGWAMTLQHKQDGLWGGWNKLALQYGVGPGTALGGTGNTASGSDVTRLRVVEQLYFQTSPALDGQVTAVYQHDDSPGGDQDWISLGGRLTYALGGNWKLLGELGHDQVIPTAGATRQLTKFTIAPTWSAAKGLFGRPEVRLFYTWATWNDAARLAAAPGDPLSASGVYGGDKHGSTLGVQAEYWW